MCTPWVYQSLKFHLGTDMLVASWLFLIASALFLGTEIQAVIEQEAYVPDEAIYEEVGVPKFRENLSKSRIVLFWLRG